MATRINVPCNGNAGVVTVSKVNETITFGTSGNCTFINFSWDDPQPTCFSNRNPATGGGATISYDYDGSAIPATGYGFSFSVTTPAAGNGTGVIKNN